MKRLHKNQRGFGHHIIIPILAIALIAAIGVNVYVRSRAATPAVTYTYHQGSFGMDPGSGFLLTANDGTKAHQDEMAKTLTDFEQLGVRWIRSSIPWKNIQPTDPGLGGQYNFNGIDSLAYMLNDYPN